MSVKKMHITDAPRCWTLEELHQAYQTTAEGSAERLHYVGIINKQIVSKGHFSVETDKKELIDDFLLIIPVDSMAYDYFRLCLQGSILREISLAETKGELEKIEAACLPPDGHKNGGFYTSPQGLVWVDSVSLGVDKILSDNQNKKIHNAIKKRLAALKRKAKAEEKRQSENLIIVANMTYND